MRPALQFLWDLHRARFFREHPGSPDESALSRLFEGTDAACAIPLWESAYAENRRVLLDRTTLSVLEAYFAQRLQPVPGDLLPDDLGLEAEFLLRRLTEGDADSCAAFASAHFLPLLSAFAARLAAQSDSFLSALGQTAQDCLPSLPALFAAPLSPAEQAECQARLPALCHFLPISPQEAALRLTPQTVLTSGRGNCGGRCRIKLHVAAGCVTELESAAVSDHARAPLACVRGRGYRQTFLSSDRLRYPLLRTGPRGAGHFRRISWDEALDRIAAELAAAKAEFGPGSRYVNYASGVGSVLRGDLLAQRLLAMDGGFLGNYNTYSAACAENAVPITYGTADVGSSLDTFRRSELLLLWSFNPVVTLFNPLMLDLLQYHKRRGTPIVVVDPQFSDTAALFATQWIPIRPGTDAAMAAAMAYVIWTSGLQDQSFLDRFCLGFDRAHMPPGCENEESFLDYLLGRLDGIPKTPQWAAPITGVPAETIHSLAVSYATRKPAALLSGLGVQRHGNGEQNVRMLQMLPCITGNVGVEGGCTGANSMICSHRIPAFPAVENPYGASIPSFLWTDAVTRGHEMTRKSDHVRGRERLDSDVKFIFNLAGNTLLNQHSDAGRTAEILRDESKCRCIVVSDLFMTPSARFADILLPGASLFEVDGMVNPWREGNFLLYGKQAIQPPFECRFEADWLMDLARRMGLSDFSEGCDSVRAWNEKIYNRLRPFEPELPDFETLTRDGGYVYRHNSPQIAFAAQISDPAHHPFPTESGKIEIFSRQLLQYENPLEIPPIPKYVPSFEGVGDPNMARYPIQLLGWHTKRRCHSVHDNNPWMEAVEPHRCWLSPQDAAARNIAEGDYVRVFNDRGAVRMRAHVSARIMQGVACIPQGAWYTPDGENTDVRGCINTLTTLRPTPLAKGNPQHSNLVEIRRDEHEADP